MTMKYLAIDQNKWIELDEARRDPARFPAAYKVLEFLVHEVDRGRLSVPLFQSNIYETHRIDNCLRRESRAHIQCAMSNGRVVRCLSQRRSVEVRRVLAKHFKKQFFEPPSNWFVSKRFWDAAGSITEEVSRAVIEYVELNPAGALFSYLTDADEDTRLSSVKQFSESSKELIGAIEMRRQQTRQEGLSMRRKALSVHLWMDSQIAFWVEVDALDIPTPAFKESKNDLMRDLVRKVPCLHVERELTLVIEADPVSITENDLRDMQFYTAAIPHMQVIVGEGGFVSRAQQAGLDEMYDVAMTADLLAVPDMISKA